MNKTICNAMLSSIQKEIRENINEIKKVEEIDLQYCKMKIDYEKIIEIIEYFKSKDIHNLNEEVYIYCNGNPYIVVNLAMIAIIYNCKIKINIDNVMLGVNKIILAIINKRLTDNKIELFEKLDYNKKVILIDRFHTYESLKNKEKNIKIIPYESLDTFSDSEEFEELYETVYNYALDMNLDIDIFDGEEIDSLFKYGKGKIKLIFTRDEKIIEKYKNKYVNVFINENPFKNKKIIFDNEMIKLILN